jgi:glycosyltransferase involved in cell wall biosynthesis
MIVGIDNITPGTSTSASLSGGGMRPYVQDLLLGLPEAFPQWQFKFFTPAWNEAFEVRHSNVEVVVCPGAKINRVRRVWFEQMLLPGIAQREQVDLWLGTCNYLPLRIGCKTLLLIQSHQFFTNPEAFSRVRRWWLPWIVSRSVRKADRIGVQCADARRTLLKYVDRDPDAVDVVYNRVSDLGSVQAGDDAAVLAQVMGRRRPYILYISRLYPFKNHERLIEAFASIRAQFPDLALVLAGSDDQGGGARELRSVAEGLGVGGDVVFTGKVPQPAIPVLYRNAEFSVFPSLEETFGLPVLEAMSMDCPVVTSNVSSMAEIAGDAAVLVDPLDVTGIADGLRRVLMDGDLKRELISRGRVRCEFFTREQTIASVAKALESALRAAA